ncbi:hypothetical protein HMI49_26460 [Corallococcus exercitus]|uniref:Lipoprotein n=1 Tax=Corallococcus exercitus TaxID=2316736 RepID=A0A7Y4NV62_9BACT|nr:hypothetical protein [Corallococcus exercitus]NOK36757.1 hypothetical protein [Corallococcus exercitus]
MTRRWMAAALTLFTLTACGPEDVSESGPEEVPASGPEGSLRGQEQEVWGWYYTSEELAPAECDGDALAYGASCSHAFCDDVRLGCNTPPSGTTKGYPTWTASFSEESTRPTICPNGSWVTGLSCSGGYCDNVSLECTPISGRSAGNCYWSDPIADGKSTFIAPANHFIRGAKCAGWWCESMTLYYCEMI